jgi:EAL domain-containing protein (putative c-di-GMP-specific phosphodiesterase class I)
VAVQLNQPIQAEIASAFADTQQVDCDFRWRSREHALMTAQNPAVVCRSVPPERGTLYLSTTLSGAAASLHRALVRAGLSATECQPGVFAVPFSSRKTEIWRNVFSGAFSPAEINTVKCVLLPPGSAAAPAELMQSESLAEFLQWLEGQWLIGVLESRRLISVYQPIVHTDDPQNVYAYECLLRGRAAGGQWIMPDRLFAAARNAGLLERLDSAARNIAVESAAQHGVNAPVFVNIYPNAVQNSKKFLENTLAATRATGLSPHRFVFEFVESEEIVDPASFVKTLELFRGQGFRVALDDVGAGYASLNVLVHVKPDFMKLDMGLIRDVDTDLYKSRVAAKLLELAQELNVKTVVEGIETVGEWQWSREHGADFAQGYLFARPDNPPPRSRFWGTDLPNQTTTNGLSVGLR